MDNTIVLTTLGKRNEQISRNPQKVVCRLAIKSTPVLSLSKLEIKRGDESCKGASEVHHCEWSSDTSVCSCQN